MCASQANGAGVSDDADFTPNPRRAVWIVGRLDETLLEQLRPQIAELHAQGPSPITVYIDSLGGSAAAGERILGLLRSSNQDGENPCRIITVAAPKAGSAAADLLSAGDFSIAYPHSTLIYHGTGWPLPEQRLTAEWTRIGRALPTLDEVSAAKHAQNSVLRFLRIVSTYRGTFEQHRAEANDSSLTDLHCFERILRGKLSPAAQKVVERAVPLWNDYDGLLFHFQKRLRRGRTFTKAKLQKIMMHSAVAFENEKGDQAWDGGLGRICDHFYFLNAYFDVEKLCDWIAARAEPQPADTGVDADYYLQFRLFGRAICRALQEGENQITPMDAVWLGLIDTVR
jgi:hypothetical protein